MMTTVKASRFSLKIEKKKVTKNGNENLGYVKV